MSLNPQSITELRNQLQIDIINEVPNLPKKITTKDGKITKKAIEYNKRLIKEKRFTAWYDKDTVYNISTGKVLKKQVPISLSVLSPKVTAPNKAIDKKKLVGNVIYPNNVNINDKVDKDYFNNIKANVKEEVKKGKTFQVDIDMRKVSYNEIIKYINKLKTSSVNSKYHLLGKDDKGQIITFSVDNLKRLADINKVDNEGYERAGSDAQFVLGLINTAEFSIIFREKKDIGNKNHNGAFFKYYHKLKDMDFSRYDIYNEAPKRYTDNCFIVALKNGGLEVNKLSQIKSFVKGMHVPLCKLNTICKKVSISISVKRMKGDNDSKTTHYGDKEHTHFNLGLIDEHFFILDKETNITSYALNNYNDINDNKEYNKIYKKICDNKNKSNSLYKKANDKFVDSFTLVKLLLKNKDNLLTTIPLQDLIECQFYNENITHEKESLFYSLDNIKDIWISEKDNSECYKIFFDFETYTNEKIHKPYLCCMRTQDNKRKSFIGEDCGRRLMEFIKNMYKNAKIKVHEGRDKGSVGEVLLVAHNFRYDFTFILKHIYALNPVLKGNSVMGGSGRLYFEKGRFLKISFQDTNNLCPMKLKKFPKTFGFKVEKELMPYDLYTGKNVVKRYIDLDKCLSFIKEEDKSHYMKNIKKWNCLIGDKVDIIKYSEEYCFIDCKVLHKGYEKFAEWILEITNLHIHNYCSIASLGLDYMITKGVFNDCFKVSGVIQQFIQKCVVGGRCMTRDNKKWNVDTILSDFDSVSEYPSAMNRIEGILKGKPIVIEEENLNFKWLEENTDGYFIKCIALNNPTIKRDFPLLSCKGEDGIRNFTNEVKGKVFYIDKTTYEDAKEFQGINFKIISGYYFNEGRNNKINEVIRHLFNQRLLTKSGKVIYNREEKNYTVEDILNGKRDNEILEAKEKGVEVEEVCNPIQSVYKLLMNSCYGKCLLKPIDTETKIVTEKDWDKYLNRNYNFMINSYPISDKIRLVKEQKPINTHFNIVHAGVEILSMAKRIMNEVMCLAEDKGFKIYYTDTDSMHIEADKVEPLGEAFKEKYKRQLIGKDMGQFHTDFELEGCKDIVSIKSYFLGKKCYIDRLEGINKKTNKKEYGHHIRMKGVNIEGIEHFKDNNDKGIDSFLKIYEKLYEGKELAFDLVAGGKCVKFEYNKDMSVSSRSEFIRHVQFNSPVGIETH